MAVSKSVLKSRLEEAVASSNVSFHVHSVSLSFYFVAFCYNYEFIYIIYSLCILLYLCLQTHVQFENI